MTRFEKFTRQEANRAVLKILHDYVESFPDWRFHQILQNAGISAPGADQWYEESTTTLRNAASTQSPSRSSS